MAMNNQKQQKFLKDELKNNKGLQNDSRRQI